MIDIGARIKTERNKQRLVLKDISEKLGWQHTSRLSQYERNEREPTLGVLEQIADVMGISLQTLLFGEELKQKQVTSLDTDDFILTPLCTLTCKDGLPSWNASSTYIPISKATHQSSPTSQQYLRAIQVENDQMEPYLQKGDIAILDTTDQTIADGSVYLLGYSETWSIRRIYTSPDGGLILSADNPKHPAMQASRPSIAILGRIIWRGG
ncbi:XRE family transcriptional regulator [Pseudogulbenkiania ferrooxidans]|uniref:HTH cro/C1-type domain-containing protein n=1 Tax=Pseudogulbenkiania ferrooxidans EGD-HP2 TaxID=1388764 RepID=A0ABN0N7R9_9NEIS|nr:LexA family transcriptional regulator [Pseudogulbenkiania ferrooxidans]ERE07200.1 hypothetical protein O166_06450 [Pseudogulbenkiania ferrooxidans EGD-HP2]